MKKLLVLFLMLVTFVPCNATSIDIRKEGTTHHGGMRMPSMMQVSADYGEGRLAINLLHYIGNVYYRG